MVRFDSRAASVTGAVWPDVFTYVGRISLPNLQPSEVRIVGPLAWDPPSPYPSDHFCLYVRSTSPQDPITFAEVPTVRTNTQNVNNIAQRNIHIVDPGSLPILPFKPTVKRNLLLAIVVGLIGGVGLAFFMEGLRLGLMPLGEAIGSVLPKSSRLPVILVFTFLLGAGAYLPEQAEHHMRAFLRANGA